jgi:hypothetical protein
MVEIDGVLLILILIMGIVGVVRGFLRELGVTLILVATLWALSMIGPIVVNFFNSGGLPFLGLGPVATSTSTQNVLFLASSAVVILAAFWAYEGETLAYEGQAPKRFVGIALSFLIGAVNGYLLFGTLWWLANLFNYPFGIVQTPLPETAQQVINAKLLPPDLLASGPGPLNLLAIVLLVLIVLKVIR